MNLTVPAVHQHVPDKERIRGLVAALRSGRFAQGKRFLCSVDPNTGKGGFCCLGVACEVAIESGLNVSVEDTNLGRRIYDHQTSTVLPTRVKDFYGFNDLVPRLHVPTHLPLAGSYQSAVRLNDQFDFTLDQIADCFEYTYLAVEASSPEAVTS